MSDPTTLADAARRDRAVADILGGHLAAEQRDALATVLRLAFCARHTLRTPQDRARAARAMAVLLAGVAAGGTP